MNTSDPFDVLCDLESRKVKGPVVLPAIDEVDEDWIGIAFRIGDSRLITSMSNVKEILDLPEVTTVPGVRSWVVGVANVRGSLLPIMDMKGYLLGDNIKQRHKGRVIVIDYRGFDTGLVVEEVFGMRHFRDADITREAPGVHESISPYIEHVYRESGEYWPVFDFDRLARDKRFAYASL